MGEDGGLDLAIYCSQCPLGVEDNSMKMSELEEIWNDLPRPKHSKSDLAEWGLSGGQGEN
ncbi:MAG TPA: hypothetical protein ENL09_02575 [Bacteroidetes bacterium]|nr:hypothetical protein [Bacteroidota bacterium]